MATVDSVTARELYNTILGEKTFTLLDVRNEDAYSSWRIEGERVHSLNIPYFDLIDDVQPALDQLPAEDDAPVFVVCAKEGSSEFVAEMLVESGKRNVRFLQGGMKDWSELIYPVKIADLTGGGELYQFVRPGKGCLSYLIASEGEAIVVDAARMTGVYQTFARNHSLKIKHVLDTHLHADHISGGRELSLATGGQYWLPPLDAEGVEYAYQPLVDGAEIHVGASSIRVTALYSPGHTIGSTSFIVDGHYLLSGDILFVKSIGRPDLAGKAEDWVADLRHTLYHTYKELSPDLVLLPAHFASYKEQGQDGSVQALLGDLFAHNDGLHVQDEADFRRLVTENLPPQPNAYQEIRKTNMGLYAPEQEEQREMEIGPNRCAVHG